MEGRGPYLKVGRGTNLATVILKLCKITKGIGRGEKRKWTLVERLPSGQADEVNAHVPLNTYLTDRPQWHGGQGSTNGKAPECVTNRGVWV